MSGFAACDLCLTTLGQRIVDLQISAARLVQLTDEGEVAHRANGLRNLRLCEPCGEYVRGGLARLKRMYEAEPERQRRAS